MWSPIFLAMVLLISGCGGKGNETATFTKLTLVVYPGFGPAAPAGSSCDRTSQPFTYTVEAASRKLSISSCTGPISAPWQLQTEQRVLTPAEFAFVQDSLAQVAPSQAMTCGADASVITLDLESRRGIDLFADDFYSGCPWELHARRTFVTGLGNLASVLDAL